ncbi:hypothetical protein GCM10009678_79470 [Actinomadura kijaniata]|uniref:2-methylcitrate dehydratase PrpD n=1 Tax=Actinomadura namibiensis TaxID=182080 RepID=A0A7W3QRL1_ACTNM|nr:hypothetical protein [Actinomadura namibiensis]MBA8956879.1 2-methylcitrate dehydratase PrpD [Actinomadura namibiensis]
MLAPTLRTVAKPREEKARPRTPYHAKFSGPFTFTEETLRDPARLALAAKVACVADERAGALFPTAFAAVLRARTRGGATLEHRVGSSRGGPGAL